MLSRLEHAAVTSTRSDFGANAPTVATSRLGTGPLQALAFRLLDSILWVTWRMTERPQPVTGADRRRGGDLVRFHCQKCEQAWLVPASMTHTFVFRCDCGERMF